MSRWSESCVDRGGGRLREFDRRADAIRAAKFDPLSVSAVEPYECPKCDHWHLRPVEATGPIPTDGTCLQCSGRDGRPKIAHPTYESALEQALSTTGAQLTVYQCPHGRGWHLTRA